MSSASASHVPSITLPCLVMLSLSLLPSACDVSPEASPFAYEDDAPPVASRPDTPDADDTGEDDEPEPDAPGLLAFVTSLQYTADLGGLAGADEICRWEAEAAQLPGTFRAWISDASADAIDRIEADGPWHDLHGERVFNNHANLRTSPLSALDLDPFGEVAYAAMVWTGTGAGGRWLGTGTCSGWSSEDDFSDAGSGQAVEGAAWTDFGPMPCPWEARLYCLQVQ
jgi:hypothetical protein